MSEPSEVVDTPFPDLPEEPFPDSLPEEPFPEELEVPADAEQVGSETTHPEDHDPKSLIGEPVDGDDIWGAP